MYLAEITSPRDVLKTPLLLVVVGYVPASGTRTGHFRNVAGTPCGAAAGGGDRRSTRSFGYVNLIWPQGRLELDPPNGWQRIGHAWVSRGG